MKSRVHTDGLFAADQVTLESGPSATRPPDHRALIIEGLAPGRPLAAGRRIRWSLPASDAGAITASIVAVHSLQGGLGTVGTGLILTVLVGALVWVATFQAFGLYRPSQTSWEEFGRLLGATAVGILLVMVVTPWWTGPLSRSSLAWTWGSALALEVFARSMFRWRMKNLARDGRLAMRTAVVGTNGEARQIVRTLSAAPERFALLGHVNSSEDAAPGNGLPALGSLGELSEILRRDQVECIVLASSALAIEDVLHISRACRQAQVEIKFLANIPDILAPRLSLEPIADAAALRLTPVRLSGGRAALKRAFDMVVGSLGLVLGLPVLVVAALGVRLTSRGPVLFRQTRVTKNGRTFTMYKFRTMVNDPERALAGKVVDLTEPFFKLKDDPRLTRFGRFLRRWSVDELPQLFNVLLGDMSIVGPRPLWVEQVRANLELLGPRHEVRCGITGWWQVSGRSEIDSEEALRLDLFYVENWSVGLDLYILLRTFGAVIARKGAW
jgi:exopolysaccharide biosynthesis polyprenyl glycosylphosphotransferase